MQEIQYNLGRGQANYLRCDGDGFSTPMSDWNAYSTINTVNNVFSRPSTPETTSGAGSFRPYTNHWCIGERFGGNPYGQTQRIKNYVCEVPPGGELARADHFYGCLATGIQLGELNDPGVTSEETRGLLTQAYASVQEGLFDASTNLGELPEVAAMLMNVRRRLLECFEQTARKAIRGQELDRWFREKGGIGGVIRHVIQLLSNLWLEYRYGWRPLLSSVHDLNKAIVALKIPGSSVRSGMAVREVPIARTVQIAQTSFDPAFKQALEVQADTRRVDRASVAAMLKPETFAFTDNIAATGYNLIPLSFVLNWFIDVESYLRSFSRLPRSSRLTMCTSSYVGTALQVNGIPPEGTWEQTFVYPTAIAFQYEKFEYVRTVVPGFQPTIATEFDLKMDDTRIYDLVALLIQRLFR